MNCPHCGKDLEGYIYKNVEGRVTGTVQVFHAGRNESDREGDIEWDNYDFEREDYEEPFICSHCDIELETELVYAHFEGKTEEEYKEKKYKCTKTINLFGRADYV